MTDSPPYLGAFYYNETPESLGGSGGFRQMESYAALEQAYEDSRALNHQFNEMGLFTESHLIWAVDYQAYTLFHVLVVSTKPHVWLRQFELLETTITWLKTQGHPELDPAQIGIAGTAREAHERIKQQLKADWEAQQTALEQQTPSDEQASHSAQDANIAHWEASLDEQIAQAPYRKRQLLDRLCQHFNLMPAQWVDLAGYWDDPQVDPEDHDPLDYWNRFVHPAEKQLYDEVDRIIPPLQERFALPLPDEDWYSLHGMIDIYTAIMTAAGQDAGLPWDTK